MTDDKDLYAEAAAYLHLCTTGRGLRAEICRPKIERSTYGKSPVQCADCDCDKPPCPRMQEEHRRHAKMLEHSFQQTKELHVQTYGRAKRPQGLGWSLRRLYWWFRECFR